MAQMNFNAGNVDPQSNFDPVPAGQYLVMIVDSAISENSKKSGDLLKLTFEVMQPEEYKGRKIFQNINVRHQNKQAEEIGQRQLSAISHAVNELDLTDSVQLHNKPLGVKVIIDEQPGYSPKNEIKGYYNEDGSDIKGNGAGNGQAAANTSPAQSVNTPAQQQMAAEPAAAAQTANSSGGSKPPWQR